MIRPIAVALFILIPIHSAFADDGLLEDVLAYGKYTATTAAQAEDIRLGIEMVTALAAKMDPTLNVNDFRSGMTAHVQREGLNLGAVVPTLQMIDRFEANEMHQLSGLGLQALDRFNPRMAGSLAQTLGIEMGGSSREEPGIAEFRKGLKGHGRNRVGREGMSELTGFKTGLNKANGETTAIMNLAAQGRLAMFGPVATGGDPRLQQYAGSDGCLGDITINVITTGFTAAGAGQKIGGAVLGPEGAIGGAAIGGSLGAARGIVKGFEQCKERQAKEKAEPQKGTDQPKNEPAKNEPTKEAEKPKSDKGKDDKDKDKDKPKIGNGKGAGMVVDGGPGTDDTGRGGPPIPKHSSGGNPMSREAWIMRVRLTPVTYPTDAGRTIPSDAGNYGPADRESIIPHNPRMDGVVTPADHQPGLGNP